jgi:ribosome-associated protein
VQQVIDVSVDGDVPLGSFLKLAGVAPTGGQAKVAVQTGEVCVNGAVERRRGRTLHAGDIVAVGGEEYRVCSSPT